VDDIIHSEVDLKAEISSTDRRLRRVLFSSLLSMSNRNNGRTGMGQSGWHPKLKAVVARGRKRDLLIQRR
jgi:hypothetical protein